MTLRPPGARSRDSPRLPFGTLPRLLRPRSASLLRAAHPRHSTAIAPGLLTYPAWSPRIAELLSTPRGAAASPQRPGALYPAQADTLITTPLGPPLHITGAAHTGLTLPGPTRSRDPRLYGPCAPNQNQLWTCQGCTKPPCNLGARQWHHSQTLPGVQAPTGTTEYVSARRPPGPHHVTRQAPRGLRLPKPLKRGHPTRRASTGGGGSTPNPPCCSPFGDANGVRNP